MQPIVILYIAAGVSAMFFGTIQGDLLSLGIKGEIVSIVEKALTAVVTLVGTIALTKGVTLPPIPAGDKEPEQV